MGSTSDWIKVTASILIACQKLNYHRAASVFHTDPYSVKNYSTWGTWVAQLVKHPFGFPFTFAFYIHVQRNEVSFNSTTLCHHSLFYI